MDPIRCFICEETNHIPERQVIVVATFSQKYQAEQALFEIQKSHINFVWQKIFIQQNLATLVLQLHGIKDIVNLQSLYIESICQQYTALTIDIVTQKVHQEKFLSTLS